MRGLRYKCILIVAFFLAACHSPQREARHMVRRAEQLADTLPDSTASLIDSVLHMPVYFSERQRMDMALLQAEALFGDHGQEISPLMDDDFFDDKPFLSTSPDLERAAAYYSGKKQYTKAAHAALYSGFVQQHYNDKTAAMQSFKDAERYGEIAKDSLALAMSQYWMGKLLYEDGMVQDALNRFKESSKYFGGGYIGCAKVLNSMACCYLICGQYDSTEICLNQGLALTHMDCSNKLVHKILNNFAILNRIQGKYDLALKDLGEIEKEMDSTEMPFLYLNKAKVFVAMNNADSADYYFNKLKPILLSPDMEELTKVSAYEALSLFAKGLGNDALALQYRETHERLFYNVMRQRQEQNIYRIQQQYDYESLQNEMNRKLIRRHRVIILVSVLAILGLAALAVSQIRMAKIRKHEAEAKTNLFHFMQQNKELQQKHDDNERVVMNYEQRLSDALNKEALIMRKLDIFLSNKGEKVYLGALNDAVFGGNDHWDALMEVFDTLYPGVRENLRLQHPELTEMEQKDFILSYFNVSRDEEALMFNKSVHMVDKWRNSVRKKMQAFDAKQHQEI